MFTKPADLAEETLAAALRDRWRFTAASLEYQAVGFGSHHWLATNAEGRRLFVTVDDLAAKLRTADDSTDAAFGRLGCSSAPIRRPPMLPNHGRSSTAISVRPTAGPPC